MQPGAPTTEASPAAAAAAEGSSREGPGGARPPRRRWVREVGAVSAALALLLVAALALRLWSLGHGLPFVFNQDEELHFVPVALEMMGGSLNPGYFENPPALSYLLLVVFGVSSAVGLPLGAGEALADPAPAYLTARVVVALLGTALVALVYWAGSRFGGRRAGLVSAALIAFAFLPVFYSKQALNDVVTLVPVTVALVASLLVLERGRLLDWALAGAAVGVATATKYTAGAMLATLAVAALGRLVTRRDSLRPALVGAAVAGVAFVAAFFVLNPFALLDFGEFRSQLGGQSAQAGGAAKLGQADVPGWVYYAWTLTWGLGALPALAALAGGWIALRRDLWRGLLLVAFPVLLFLFLGAQARYFGRWLLPAYPALAVLAGVAAVQAADAIGTLWARRERGGKRGAAPVWSPETRWRTGALVAIGVLLVAQGLASSVRVSALLGQRDTRALSRAWMVERIPAGAGVVVEPFVPSAFLAADGPGSPERWRRYPVKRPFQAYERRLDPALVDRYRAGGFCWVVTGSHQKERGLEAGLRGAQAYYRRLDASTAARATFSPYEADAEPPPFSFDLSFNYLPNEYLRPGPLVDVHRLSGCDPRRRPPPA